MSLSLLANTSTTTPFITSIPLQKTKSPPFITRTSVGKRSFSYTSCEQRQEGGSQITDGGNGIDRRNVLIGLGGIYGATATVGGGNMALGAPVQPPDLTKCHKATDSSANIQVQCCPPYNSANIVDFQLPNPSTALRVRKAAEKVDSEWLAKYKEAISKMKALDKDDPWNYMQQAQIHCAYCNGAYDQVGFPDVLLQVHGSWLFLPWHRYYLYFWEKILGKLINDSTFAIPYWHWDAPVGMRMPNIYLDPTSPLYDDLRDHNHYNALLDLKYSYGDPNPTPDQEEDVILNNLKIVFNLYQESLGKPELFMGKPISAGEEPTNDAGGMENLHNINHMWVGPPTSPYYNMGNFYTAARDTMFFGHHANIDLMWDTYRQLRGNKLEFTQKDWLNASFIFYDENRQVVKCKVKDCLDTTKLGYTYKTDPLEWKNIRRKYFKKKKANKRKAGADVSLSAVSEFGTQPRVLDSTIRALVTRPKVSRSKDDKEDAPEVVIVDDIKLDIQKPARFDVYISKPIEGLASSDLGEFAGSFVKVPHSHGAHSTTPKNIFKVGITSLLEDIDAESAEKVVVSLVPRLGEVTIGNLSITLLKEEEEED